eukprot:jgi/Mesvir1/1202/Mv17692-RA.3
MPLAPSPPPPPSQPQFLMTGFLVCIDSFLAIFTLLPVRLLAHLARMPYQVMHGGRLRPDQICDFLAMAIVVVTSWLLHQAEISTLYHWIRSQEYMKLYVIFNMLDLTEKLCASFISNGIDALFYSASASLRLHAGAAEVARCILDWAVCCVWVLAHALVLMMQAITLNVAINSHDVSLLTLLVSNNFMEIKSSVFKKMNRELLRHNACMDVVERFHMTIWLIFVFFQGLASFGDAPWPEFYAWLTKLAKSGTKLILAEMFVDTLKHAFLAKYNNIEPVTYSEFLQELCQKTAMSQHHLLMHRALQFVPFASACVVRPNTLLFSRVMEKYGHSRRCVHCMEEMLSL